MGSGVRTVMLCVFMLVNAARWLCGCLAVMPVIRAAFEMRVGHDQDFATGSPVNDGVWIAMQRKAAHSAMQRFPCARVFGNEPLCNFYFIYQCLCKERADVSVIAE